MGAIYSYFKNRDELLIALGQTHWPPIKPQVKPGSSFAEIMQRLLTPELVPDEVIRAAFAALAMDPTKNQHGRLMSSGVNSRSRGGLVAVGRFQSLLHVAPAGEIQAGICQISTPISLLAVATPLEKSWIEFRYDADPH